MPAPARAASERNAARLEAEVATHGYFAAPGKPASLEARFTPVPASKLASLEAPAPARRSFRLSHQA